jgi:hypothetical protein
MDYAHYASTFGDKTTVVCNYCDHFQFRWIPILITAFFYHFLGINDITSALFSLLCFLITAFFIYQFIKKEPLKIQLLTYVLFFFNHSTIFYAHRLLGDGGICAFNFIAYYFYHQYTFGEHQQRTFKYAFLVSVFLMLLILTKESVIIIFPLWFILLITDIFKRRNIRFWLLTILIFVLFTFFYLLYFKLHFNDWFFRYHLLQNNSSAGTATIPDYTGPQKIERIILDLLQAFLLNGDMEFLLFAIVALFYHKTLFTTPGKRQMLLALLILFLSSNFMTYTPLQYKPLWPDPRHFLFIMPFAVIVGAQMLQGYIKDPVRFKLLLILFLIASSAISFSDVKGTRYIYYGLTIILLVCFVISIANKRANYFRAFYIAFGVVMFANYLFDFIVKRYSYYYNQKDIVQSFLAKQENNITVFIGDVTTGAMTEYFLSYKENNIRFVNLDTCTTFDLNKARKYYLISNEGYNLSFARQASLLSSLPIHNRNFYRLGHVDKSSLYKITDGKVLARLRPYASMKF